MSCRSSSQTTRSCAESQATVATAHTITGTPYKRYKPVMSYRGPTILVGNRSAAAAARVETALAWLSLHTLIGTPRKGRMARDRSSGHVLCFRPAHGFRLLKAGGLMGLHPALHL